jgi:prevent-host-death family protein
MATYTVHDAKTNLSKLLERVEAGEEVIIARRDKPVAKLVPLATSRARRTFGAYRGQATVTDAFFEPLPENELAAWEGQDAPAPRKHRKR